MSISYKLILNLFYKMLIIYHMCWYIQFGCQLHISLCYWHRCCAVLLILVRNAVVIMMNISVAIVIGTGVSYSISILLINSLISFGISYQQFDIILIKMSSSETSYIRPIVWYHFNFTFKQLDIISILLSNS